MKAVSNEDRGKIIKHKINGETEINISKWLFISPSSVTKIWALFCKTGSFLPLTHKCGRKSKVDDETMSNLLIQIEETPDITLNELIEKFELPITESTLSKRLKKLGYTFKKRCFIPKNKNDQIL